MASKQGHNQPGGGGGGGGAGLQPISLTWLSAATTAVLNQLDKDKYYKAVNLYLGKVADATRVTKKRSDLIFGNKLAKEKAEKRSEQAAAALADPSTGAADNLMLEAIHVVQRKKTKKKKGPRAAPGGGRRRRKRRRKTRRRTRRKTRRRMRRRRKRRHRHSKKCRHKKRCRRTRQRGRNKFRAFARSLTPAPLLDAVDAVQNDVRNLYTGLVAEKPYVSPSVMVQPSNKEYENYWFRSYQYVLQAHAQAEAKV